MSDFGLFEADLDAEQEPRRRERIAARQMTSALQEVHRRFEAYLSNADGADNFEDRFGSVRREVAKTMIDHGVGAYPAVMREAHGSLKSAWYNRYSAADGFVDPPEDDDSTINDKQKKKIDKGEKPGKDDVESNKVKKDSRLRVAGSDDGPFEDGEYLRHAPAQQLQEGREHSNADLIPQRDNHPENAETSGVQRDFTPGGDTGSDRREAMQLVADIYNDWAQGNNLRVASMDTLDLYASRGLHDNDYYVLASLIRQAEEDCECDDEDDDGDDSGPPQDSGDSESDDSGDDSDGDSEDSGSSESDSDDDSDSDFGGSDDAGDSADSGSDDSDFGDGDAAPADAGGDDFGGGDPAAGDDGGDQDFPADPAPEDSDPNAAGPGDDLGGDLGGDPNAGGQDFQVPEQAPDLPGEEQQALEQGGPDSVPPEVIDDILGLPPGTLEALIAEELQNAGGQGGPPPGPPQGGPPPQLASRSRRPFAKGTQPRASRSGYRVAADDDPAAAAAAPPAAPAQMPAAPPAGAGSAGTIPPPGAAGVAPPPAPMPLENQPAEDALLDTALQAVTQMVDRETQEYQQVIDPLNQALQAIQFAQQVEQAENPLDVTPPEGTVDTDPSAAPGGADSLQQQAARIASRYDLSENGYKMLLTAMSRKHYEHVAEAIRTLPPQLREGIAHHIGGMFAEDNPRFNHDIWMGSVGDPRIASRRPFAAGENSKNTQLLDTFEFPGQGEQAANPQISDNIAAGALPKPPKGMKPLTSNRRQAAGVVDKYQQFKQKQQAEGLGYGGDTTVENFFNTPSGKGYGDRARTEVHQVEGVQPEPKTASFFTRRVPGWKWDDHLAGYIAKEATPFTCECGHKVATPGYGNCRCGKLWYTYAIGDSNHYASNSADMYVTREIPVRDDVIMANKKMAWTSSDGWTPPDQRDVDVDWVEDEDREDADGPKAPDKTALRNLAWDAARVAGSQMVGEPVGRHDDPSFQGTVVGPGSTPEHVMVQHPGGTHEMSLYDLGSGGPQPQGPSLKDKVRNHLMERMQRSGPPGGFAGGRSAKLKDDDYIVKYDDDEDAARAGGPKKPPSTTVKGGDPKWHSRGDQGKFKNTSPFGG